MNKIITITLILICVIVSGNVSAANKKSDIYAFGFSASFNDSTVYFTDIQLVKDVTIEHKSHFLENRDLYSKQLSQHLSDQGMPARVCVIFFDAKLKNIEKQFTKLKKKYAKNGAPIFDSVASNATAHYLENMLWVSGCELTDVEVQTFRANPIETFDTIVLRGRIGTGRLTFVASHAIGRKEAQNPMFEYVFEKGRIAFGGLGKDGAELTFHFNDGTEKRYGDTNLGTGIDRMHKLWDVVDAIRDGGEIACTAEDAMLHTRAMAQIFEKCPEAYAFPVDEVYDDNGQNWVPGLRERLIREYLRQGREVRDFLNDMKSCIV